MAFMALSVDSYTQINFYSKKSNLDLSQSLKIIALLRQAIDVYMQL
jgi:hypothetical protein